MTARRARQLQNGSAPLIDTKSVKACRVAQDEIAAGHITHVVTVAIPKVVEAPIGYTPIIHT